MNVRRDVISVGLGLVAVIVAAVLVVGLSGCGMGGGPGPEMEPTEQPRAERPSVPTTPGKVKGTRVNVRAGASVAYETLAQLSQGKQVDVVAVKYGWCQVLLPHGSTAWIAADYVSLKESEEARLRKEAGAGARRRKPFVGTVTADDVRVRARSGLKGTAMYRVFRGEKVEVVGMKVLESVKEGPAEWYEISAAPDAAGWVQKEYVELSTPPAPLGQ